MNHLTGISRIWSEPDDTASDIYRLFRTRFTWSTKDGKEVFLRIAVNDTFLVRINGKRVPVQQQTDCPGIHTFSEAVVTDFIREGENEILAEVHRIGLDFSTVKDKPPFLQAAVFTENRILTATGLEWEWLPSEAFRSGFSCRVSPQLGFTFEYDMRKEHPGGKWRKAVLSPLNGDAPSIPRTVPQLIEREIPSAGIAMTGILFRKEEKKTAAESCFADLCAPVFPENFFAVFDQNQLIDTWYRTKFKLGGKQEPIFTTRPLSDFPGANGFYVVCDLGKETVGYLTFSIDAPAGTVLDIAHGEHLEDGRVRAAVGNRNFADRVICKEGRNDFTYVHRRIAGRYLELHITRLGSGVLSLRHLSLIPLELPLPPESGFRCEDRLLLHTNRIAADTLKNCMHEHYEDCPWREQSLYAYDSRNQMLYGYYLWGNADFARASLDMLGTSGEGRRYLQLTSPGWWDKGDTIPIFTLVWISAVLENLMFSGSDDLFRKRKDQIDGILDAALASPDAKHSGLFHPGTGNVWNFCEWNGALSGMEKEELCTSYYNIYLYESLLAGAKLHRLAGSPERAEFLETAAARLGKAVERIFYDEEKKAYRVFPDKSLPEEYEHIQALMLAAGLVPEEKTAPLLALLREKKLRRLDFSAMYYWMTGLMNAGPEARVLLTESLQNAFDPIVLSGSTSLWETVHGADDFSNAGSLCHAWSSVLPCWCRRHVLGVSPLEPGFRKFLVKPYPAHLSHAEGEIPTPHGRIRVEWKRGENGMSVRVRCPHGTEPVWESYPEAPIAERITEAAK